MTNETFCAVISNNKVTNIIVVANDSELLATNENWVFIGENPLGIGIGWDYNGSKFIAPPQPVPPPVSEPLPPPKTEEQKIADATAAAIAKLIADGVLKQG